MEVKFDIPDDKVKYFSGNAKNKISEYSRNYALDIISEAERVEFSTHIGDSPSEVTTSHLGHAVNKFRSISGAKKKKVGLTVFKIISEFLILIAGIMFLPDQFITENKSFNIIYFIVFIIVLTAALITTIMSHFLGGE